MGPPPVRPAVGGELDWGVGAVTYGVAQRPSKKDEDRFLLAATGVAWADFVCAVLDGHNGRRAAEACSARLVTLVDAELARLTAAAGGLRDDHADEASPNWHPQLEAALTAAFVRMDAEIKKTVPDGTTASFVMLKRARNGAIGVKVAWVGDSRAVLARYTDGGKTEVTPLTRDHKASDVMEAARIEAFYAALHRRGSNRSDSDEGSYHGAEAALSAMDEGSQVLTEDMFGKKLKAGENGSTGSGSHRGSDPDLNSRRSQGGNTMEEEVNVAFANLEGMTMADFDPSRLGMNVGKNATGELVVTLPPRGSGGTPRKSSGQAPAGGVSSMDLSAAALGGGEGSRRGSSNTGNQSPGSSMDNSRHGPSELLDMRTQLQKANARGSASAAAAPPPKPPPPKPSVLPPSMLAATQAAAAAAAQRDRRSFVARLRDPETGALSNLRLFGGNVGASTAMTRSIGDAGAARCCIAEPEFTTQLVAPAQRARIIIASDGLWDVYANEEAEQLSRGTRLDAPRSSAECATLLAARALEDRAFDGLAADDITTLVIDIRGGGLAAAGGPSGSCCVVQ